MAEFWSKVGKTLHFYSKKGAIRFREAIWEIAPPIIEKPVFIIGCSRSGTTVVYKAFSQAKELGSLDREVHDDWAALHSLESRDWVSHQLTEKEACKKDRDWASRLFYTQAGKKRFLDKNNQAGLCVLYLYALYPDASFVFVKRSPGDTINSMIEGWKKPDEFGVWSKSLPEEVKIDNGKFKRWCFFLPTGWKDYLKSPIEAVCAFQYISINEAILDAKTEIPASQWTEICYEDLLKEPVDTVTKSFQEIGLTVDERLKQNLKQVMGQSYNAFSEIRQDKWKESENAEKIRSILPLVASLARKLDYPL